MLVDFNQLILDVNEEPIILREREKVKDEFGKEVDKESPMTLGAIAQQVLLGEYKEDHENQITGEERSRRGHLAMEIYKSMKNDPPTPVDMSSEDIVHLRKLISRIQSTIVVTRARDLLK